MDTALADATSVRPFAAATAETAASKRVVLFRKAARYASGAPRGEDSYLCDRTEVTAETTTQPVRLHCRLLDIGHSTLDECGCGVRARAAERDRHHACVEVVKRAWPEDGAVYASP